MRVVAVETVRNKRRDTVTSMYSRPLCCVYTFFFLFFSVSVCITLTLRYARASVDVCTWIEKKKIARRINLFTFTLVCMRTNEQANKRASVRVCMVRSCISFRILLYIHRTQTTLLYGCVWVLTPQTLISTTWVWLTDSVCKQRDSVNTHSNTLLNNGPDSI